MGRAEQLYHLNIPLSRQPCCKMVVVTYRLFLIPLTSPSGCSLETQTSLVAERLLLAARRAFVGHPRRLMEGARKGGRKGVSWPSVSSSDLLSATTGTASSSSPPPPHYPASNPNVYLLKIGTSPFVQEEFSSLNSSTC